MKESTDLTPDEDRRLRAEARRTVNAHAGLRWHVLVYALVSALLVVVNLMTTPAMLWCLFPIGGWGAGVAMHAFAVVGRGGREARIEAEVARLRAQRRTSQ